MHDPDDYNVALKLFVVQGETLLLLGDARNPGDLLDFPGGRINVGEEHLPLQECLKREVTEELGDSFRYELLQKEPVALFRNFFERKGKQYKIFLLGFAARQTGGKIVLSDEHNSVQWVKISDVNPNTCFSKGFAGGFKQFKQWFEKQRA